MKIPEVAVEEGWEELRLPFNIGSGRTLYSGQEQSGMARFRFFRKPGEGKLIGRAWFGPGTDGPPGYVHGGALAYVLDEAMGATAWMNEFPAVAAKLEFQYFQMSPLGIDLHVDAQITTIGDDRITIESRIRLPTAETCVVGRGSFAILSREQGETFRAQGVDPHDFLKTAKLKWAK